MKKVAAVFVSLGVILVIAGLVMVGIFGGEALKKLSWHDILNGTSHDLTIADEHHDFEESEIQGLTDIVVNTNLYTVYILPSENDTLSVKYVKPTDDDIEITVTYDELSTLTITEKDDSKGKHWWFWDNWLDENRFIAVYLPQTEIIAQANLVATVNVASVKIDDVTLGSVKCDTTTGSVNVSNCSIGNVDLETKTGSASVSKLTCINLEMTTKTGSVNVDETTVEQTANIEVRTGSVNCNVTANKLVIKDNTGSVNFKVIANAIDINTNTGSVTGTVVGSQSEYQIKVKKGTGKSNISNQSVADATKFLDVEVDTGSITIDFSNN